MRFRNERSRRPRSFPLEPLEGRSLLSTIIPALNSPATVESLNHQVPFVGIATGMDTSVTPITGGVATSFSATGVATHFGRFTLVANDRDYSTSPTTLMIEDGVGTLTRTNGDQLALTYHGTGTIIGGTLVSDVDITITGGTGRFAGATGSLVSDHSVTNLATGAETIPLEGVITLHGEKDRAAK